MHASFKELFAILIPIASLLLSAYAVWVTQFNHGRLKMTQPTLLCLKREFPSGVPKVFLRTCLFTTGSKGRVIEGMFLRVRQAQGEYTFDFWGHTTDGGKLTLGSGLAVGPSGVASDHHFNPRQGSSVDFLYYDGDYHVDVYATIVGKKKPKLLCRLSFYVDSDQSAELIQIPSREMYLLWNADTHTYDGHVRHENGPPGGGDASIGIDRPGVLATLFMDALLKHKPDVDGMTGEVD